VRPADIETTTLGAAYAAGLAVGFWTEDKILASGEKLKSATIFRSTLKEALRKKKVESW
jgi:glycerol kinase